MRARPETIELFDIQSMGIGMWQQLDFRLVVLFIV